jgi:hypothetical protein
MMEAYINEVYDKELPWDAYVKNVYNVKGSKRFGEKIGMVTEFGDFLPMSADGANAPKDDIQSGPTKTIEHTTFKKQFRITREANEDGEIDFMKAKAANMVKSYKRTRAQLASTLLTCQAEGLSETTSISISGVNFSVASADGVSLFSKSHPGILNPLDIQSNRFTNAFGNDSAMLSRLANIGANFRNGSGNYMGYTFDTIIVPSNCGRLIDLAKKIIVSEQVVGSSNNDKNIEKGNWKLIVDPCWHVSDPSTYEPYILMSSEANEELMGNKFYDRVKLDVTAHVDQDTDDMIWNGYARMSGGFASWQHVIMGGAAYGTTLT